MGAVLHTPLELGHGRGGFVSGSKGVRDRFFRGRRFANWKVSVKSCVFTTFSVMRDVLALTKLNYNACIYGDGMPVTLRFADAVGDVLTAGPLNDVPPLAFKYYI